LPSLDGGWLSVEPFQDWRRSPVGRVKTLKGMMGMSEVERWGRQPAEADFFGILRLRTPDDDGAGFPDLWDRDRQLKLMYFIGFSHHVTGGFPKELHLDWPDPELEIDGLVTVDPHVGFRKKHAQLEVTLRKPIGDRRTVTGRLVVPAWTCELVSKWLADLFPSVSADDLDWF
jgi:hypothetical protein